MWINAGLYLTDKVKMFKKVIRRKRGTHFPPMAKTDQRAMNVSVYRVIDTFSEAGVLKIM